ncbi:MAG TPA: DUF2339 domain-containing protein [Terriglobia bacterium]|nr:DUF2339 domain-containing protein [Terriglobia bacterium]
MPQPRERIKSVISLEETLGTNWLNKVGVIILVIGVALFLIYELKELGPGGKVFVGYAVGLAMLGPGIFFERRERWRILARAGMGGGWALLYFTTYAMNHVPAARVLESESFDLALLLIVAAAMVAHTLRYNSQVVTGLAFLLAFTTINISHGAVTSLISGAILAVALAVVVGRRRWFQLEVVAILAVFLNHYYWLRPIIEPMGSHHRVFPELTASTALLISYWLIFRFSYIFRRIELPLEENISTVAALLNTFLFHYVINYQSARPELAFWFLLGVGSVEMVLGQLPVTRRRRTAFLILTTIGATLLVAAFGVRYSGERLSVLWLMEAEALFLAGVFTREIHFRRLGMLAQLLVAGQIVFVDSRHLFDLRDLKAIDFSDPRLGLICTIAALILFVNAHWVPRKWPDLIETGFEKTCFRFQSYLAGMVAVVGIWAVCTEPWLAVGWTAFALLLAIVGRELKIEDLSVQGICCALLGFFRVVFTNFAVVEVSHFSLRAVSTISIVIVLLYLCSRWMGFSEAVRGLGLPEAFTWVASFLMALLMWYQLWPTSVALGWALLGLILFQLGWERASTSLRLQAYVLFTASFLRVFFVNFNAEDSSGQLSPRLYTTVPLALLFYYVYWRVDDRQTKFLETDAKIKAANIHCYLGTATLAAVMRFELDPDWIAAAWSALICLFALIAWRYGRRIFLHQGLLLAVAVFFRTVLHNFYERSYFPPPSLWYGRFMTVGTTIVLLFLALLVGFRLKLPLAEGQSVNRGRVSKIFASLNRRPEQSFFFVTFILLTLFLYLEMRAHGMTTVAWGAEAVAIFLFAIAVKERSFRLSAVGLLLVCVAKIVFVDVWGLAPRDRYLTFIILGAALLSVSFLYTRYREVLRGYL